MMLWASEKAMERAKSLEPIKEYYVAFDKWLPIMHDTSKYYATPAVNMVWALQESIRIIKEEGLENRYERHEKVAKAMRAAIEAMGFEILADEGNRANTLSCILYPQGIDDAEFRKILAEEGAVVAGGLGDYAGKMFRLGHMGNVDTLDLTSAISSIERTLYRMGTDVLGKGTAAFTKELNK